MPKKKYLIVRGIELNNNNIFLSYSEKFFVKKEIEGKNLTFIGDFFIASDIEEAVRKYSEYKEWFDLAKNLSNKRATFFDALKKIKEKEKNKERIIEALFLEIERLKDRVKKLEEENKQLKENLIVLEKNII